MIAEGDITRHGNGPPLKIALIFHGMARCLWVDRRGRIRCEWHYLSELVPFTATLGPRCLWPVTTNAPDMRSAATKPLLKSRKARRSNKLNRGAA